MDANEGLINTMRNLDSGKILDTVLDTYLE